LFNLCRKNRLPENLNIVGVSRTPFSHEEFRDKLRPGAQEFTGNTWNGESWDDFVPRVWYKPGDGKKREDVESLLAFLNELEGRPTNRLYYLSTAPSLYIPVMLNLGALNMTKEEQGWRRIVIEKPFGYDLKTAQELNQAVHGVFDAKKRRRTCSFCVLPTRSLSRSGIATTSSMCR
jgi:glucose-6-phosphate 1-dehydrogenase